MTEENPCDGCTKCCNYVAIELDEPENDDDWNHIRWYLVHENIWVFIDNDDSWNIQFNTPCQKIGKEGWCTIYDKRPNICRQYTTDSCEKHGDGESHKILFKTLEEFNKWYNSGKIIPKDED